MTSFKRTKENPKKSFNQESRKKFDSKKPKRRRRRFIDVDPWQKEFGPVSERAVFEIFAHRFNIETHNMVKFSFQHCVNSLRHLEDKNYKEEPYSIIKE